jgi:DNA primase
VNTELQRVRDEVKRTVSMREVVRMVGLPDPGRDGKIRSLGNPAEKTPSLHLYEYDWYDYATGDGGDQIAFVQKATGASYVDALQVLSRNMSLTVKPRANSHDMPWEPDDLTAKYEDEPDGTADQAEQWAQLVESKWPVKLSDLYHMNVKVVESGDLWIAHYILDPDKGRHFVRGIKVRHLPDAAKSSVKGSCYTLGLYRPHSHRANRNHAIVVEGESDAWSLAIPLVERDVTVLALPSGASTLKDRYIQELGKFKSVGLALDDDEPGLKARDWFLAEIERAYTIEVPGGRVAEAIRAGWTL